MVSMLSPFLISPQLTPPASRIAALDAASGYIVPERQTSGRHWSTPVPESIHPAPESTHPASGDRERLDQGLLRYQHASSRQRPTIAAALPGLAESARTSALGERPLDFRGMNESPSIAETASQRSPSSTQKESGRPGSNRHHQLGRSSSPILMNCCELECQVSRLHALR